MNPQPNINDKTAYAIERKKRDDMLKRIQEDPKQRRRLRNVYAKLTEAEIEIVWKIYNKFTVYIVRIEKQKIPHEIIFLFAILFFQTYKRRFVSPRYEVIAVAPERKERKQDKRKHTAKEKMLMVIDEIQELKNIGYTYEQIRKELKKTHRSMFYGEPLHPRSIKRVLLDYKKEHEDPQERREREYKKEYMQKWIDSKIAKDKEDIRWRKDNTAIITDKRTAIKVEVTMQDYTIFVNGKPMAEIPPM